MFFYAAKVLWIVLQPSSLILLILLVGYVRLLRSGWQKGRRLIAGGLAAYLVCGFSPLGNLVTIPLETRIPAPGEPIGPVTGIIVLGGCEDTDASTELVTALNDSAERMTEAVALAKRFPEAKLVFTGGDASVLPGGMTGAHVARRFFTRLGVDESRLVLEGNSRNTWENAVMTRELVKPASGQRWLLVTSAFHMPRALGCFRMAGFEVEPFPVDYQTRGWGDAWKPFNSPSEALKRLDTIAKEWVGLVVYWASGKSSALFPGSQR